MSIWFEVAPVFIAKAAAVVVPTPTFPFATTKVDPPTLNAEPVMLLQEESLRQMLKLSVLLVMRVN